MRSYWKRISAQIKAERFITIYQLRKLNRFSNFQRTSSTGHWSPHLTLVYALSSQTNGQVRSVDFGHGGLCTEQLYKRLKHPEGVMQTPYDIGKLALNKIADFVTSLGNLGTKNHLQKIFQVKVRRELLRLNNSCNLQSYN